MSVRNILSDAEIAQIVESAEQIMFETLWKNSSSTLKQEMDMELHEFDGASAFIMGNFADSFLNKVIGLGMKRSATEKTIDDIIALYRQHDAPWGIALSPQAKPDKLQDWLRLRGFKHTINLAKMIRGNEPPPEIETDLRVERIDKSNAAQFGDVNSRGFGLIGWFTELITTMARLDDVYIYFAYDGDIPVGSGILQVLGEVGVLTFGSTLPKYRKRGAQSAIMAQRIRDGIDLGCRWFSTEANESTPENPNPSYHNMVRTGFELAYLRPRYVYQPESSEK